MFDLCSGATEGKRTRYFQIMEEDWPRSDFFKSGQEGRICGMSTSTCMGVKPFKSYFFSDKYVDIDQTFIDPCIVVM